MSSIPSWAVRGAKVVLVDASPDMYGEIHPSKVGKSYTLVEVISEFGQVGCRVAEWNYAPFEYSALHRFRPVVDDEAKERDLAQFRKYLTSRTPELVE